MFGVEVAFAFALGLVAAFNPCGFAMLPVYVSFFLGQDSDTSTARSVLRALKVSLSLTAGFIAVFGGFGLVVSTFLNQGTVLEYTPYVTMGLGVLLVPLGIAMLAGFELKISTPRLDKGGDSGEVVSMFLFGVSYAVVSLSCTVGLFITNVSNAFSADGFVDGMSVFIAYGLGMGAVIGALTVALALAKTSIANNMRKILPWINRISGVMLVLSGIYLAVYGWWEIQVLRDPLNAPDIWIVTLVESAQSGVNQWMRETGEARLGLGLIVLAAAAVLRGVWSELSSAARYGAGATLAAVWLALESGWNLSWDFADLLILPTIRTIIDIPERFVNWWSTVFESIGFLFTQDGENPWRWAVLGEMFVLGIVVFALYMKFGRRQDEPEVEQAADELVNA